MKQTATLKAIAGFIILFVAYHAAEYAIMFKNNATFFLLGMAAFFILTFITATWNRKSVWHMGLSFKLKALQNFIAGLLIGLLFAAVAYTISLRAGISRITYIPPATQLVTQLSYLAFGTLLTSLSEDILTRGYLFQFLSDKVSAVSFAVISSVVYVLNHIYRYNDGWLLLLHLFILGLLLVIPLIMTKNIWLTVGLHWGMNTVYQLTNNVMHTEDGDTKFSSLAVLVICEALTIPLVISFINYEKRRTIVLKK